MRGKGIVAGIVVVVAVGVLFYLRGGSAVRRQAHAHAATPHVAAPRTELPARGSANEFPDSVPRSVADGRRASRALTPQMRRRLAPLIKAFEAAVRAAEQTKPSRQAATADAAGTAPAHSGDADRDAKVWQTDADGIRGAITSSKPQLIDCYEPWLNLNPGIGGKIVVQFRIAQPKAAAPAADAQGQAPLARITDAHVEQGGLGNVFLDGCVLSVMSQLRFHPPASGVITVNYPFRFAPSAPAKDAAPAQ